MTKFKDVAVELTIVTAGVLIALFVNSLVEWNHYRQLVREARATLVREMTDNKKEIEISLASLDESMGNLNKALRFASDMIQSGKSSITRLDLGMNLADLSVAGWQSAEQTGALSHMDYAEVQEFSKLYGMQELVAAQQRTALEHLTQASGYLSLGDGDARVGTKDFETFRGQVMTLRADLVMLQQFAQRLAKNYAEQLAKGSR